MNERLIVGQVVTTKPRRLVRDQIVTLVEQGDGRDDALVVCSCVHLAEIPLGTVICIRGTALIMLFAFSRKDNSLICVVENFGKEDVLPGSTIFLLGP